ncbi:ribose-phosphate diphosphokinase [Patescibacteria group bacterium]|nr:MAG: ribose-phosphate diphosphokinase [Patescibacteria group bacterium]
MRGFFFYPPTMDGTARFFVGCGRAFMEKARESEGVMNEILVFSNTAAHAQARQVIAASAAAGMNGSLTPGKAEVGFHNDGEPWVEILSQVRGRDCVVIATIAPFAQGSVRHSVNDMAMQMLILLDALRNASARIVTVVFPYLGYLRQDRRSGKVTHRTAVSARVIAEAVEAVNHRTPHACAVEIHALQVEAFFRTMSFENIPALRTIADQLPAEAHRNAVVVSPDRGGVDRAAALKEHLGLQDLAIVYKSRIEPGKAKAERIAGDVRGRDVIVVDDMIDTAGTLVSAASFLRAEGAARITVAACHGLFSGPALERIAASDIDRIYVLDTVPPAPGVAEHPKITVLPVAPLLARAIRSIRQGESLRSLGKSEPR